LKPTQYRRRPKKRKTAKILRHHAYIQAASRYNITFTEERRRRVLEMIQENIHDSQCRCIEKQSLRRTLWRVVIDGTVCGVIYDKKHKEIVTFIPSNDSRLIERS
jgi:hypothetical protein